MDQPNSNNPPIGIPPLQFDGIQSWQHALQRNLDPDRQDIDINDDIVEEITPQILSSKLLRKKTLRSTLKNRIKQKKFKRKNQGLLLYWITIISILTFGTENLYLFLWDQPYKQTAIFLPSILLRILFFFLESYCLCRDLKIMLKLLLTFDRVLAAAIATAISVGVYCIMVIQTVANSWVYYTWLSLSPFLFLSFAGYCRVIIIYCDWKSWQTIIMKISIAIGGAAYFGLGMYYTISGEHFQGNQNQQLNQTIKNIVYLYAFAGFDLHIQIFSLYDTFDGTNKFRIDYKLESDSEDLQYLLYGKKISHPIASTPSP